MSICRTSSPLTLKPVEKITLTTYPAKMNDCFALLRLAGAESFALFGGAIRDTEYASRHELLPSIKDYDIRVWLDEADYDINYGNFLKKLGTLTGAAISKIPCPGTNHFHYTCLYQGVELDISIRPYKMSDSKANLSSLIAREQAAKSDVAISAVAIDSSGQAWARSEFKEDILNKTLTVYSLHDEKRQVAYSTRMQLKYPEHALRVFSNSSPKTMTASGFFHHAINIQNTDDLDNAKNSFQPK
jgi:hypothetical protein